MNKFIKISSVILLNIVILLLLLVCSDFILYKKLSSARWGDGFNPKHFSYLINNVNIFGESATKTDYYNGKDKYNAGGSGRLPDGQWYAPPPILFSVVLMHTVNH